MGVILGLYWGNGKEKGNYLIYRGYIRVLGLMEKKKETSIIYMVIWNCSVGLSATCQEAGARLAFFGQGGRLMFCAGSY